jgi:hypothetical protein
MNSKSLNRRYWIGMTMLVFIGLVVFLNPPQEEQVLEKPIPTVYHEEFPFGTDRGYEEDW